VAGTGTCAVVLGTTLVEDVLPEDVDVPACAT
jgi:hypothetical protein